ncbi:MAG: hypothetical protein MUF08_02845 [Burkholderiaceae bacterium]|jgi:hypothetical protein|nr:hypothetical protein [Burkholderiaceae bacterium]
MGLQRLWGFASIGAVLAMACAAWAWRDCMLLASSMVLTHRIFLLHMDRGAPWRAITAAVHAFSAGVLAVVSGLVLMAGIAAAWQGWWQPTAGNPAALLFIVGAGAAWCCLSSNSRQAAAEELRLWLLVFGGVLVAIEVQRGAWTPAPCLFVLAVGMAMLWVGWRLAAETASSLLRSANE